MSKHSSSVFQWHLFFLHGFPHANSILAYNKEFPLKCLAHFYFSSFAFALSLSRSPFHFQLLFIHLSLFFGQLSDFRSNTAKRKTSSFNFIFDKNVHTILLSNAINVVIHSLWKNTQLCLVFGFCYVFVAANLFGKKKHTIMQNAHNTSTTKIDNFQIKNGFSFSIGLHNSFTHKQIVLQLKIVNSIH